jgi:hypothetical protein
MAQEARPHGATPLPCVHGYRAAALRVLFSITPLGGRKGRAYQALERKKKKEKYLEIVLSRSCEEITCFSELFQDVSRQERAESVVTTCYLQPQDFSV